MRPGPLPVTTLATAAGPACDTHAHVIGDPGRFPMVVDRSYTPGTASLGQYLDVLARLGLERGVLVQPSFYGTDNRCMLEALECEPRRLRGIAVIDVDVPDRELARLQAAGVRGIRINELFRGGVALDALGRLAPRVADMGWHVQLLIDARRIAEIAPLLRSLPVEFVFDHFGHVPAAQAPGDPGIQAMVGLMAEGRAWVKLSAAYRIASSPDDPDVDRLAQQLLQAAPSRCLWATDWPHVGISSPAPALECLDRQLQRWLPDPGLRRQVLVDNPARLYGFTETPVIDGGDSKP